MSGRILSFLLAALFIFIGVKTTNMLLAICLIISAIIILVFWVFGKDYKPGE